MKIKKGFVLREICGQKVVSGEGLQQVDFSQLVKFNDTAAWLWNEAVKGDFTPESLATAIMSEYKEVEEQIALKDAEKFCNELLDKGLAE